MNLVFPPVSAFLYDRKKTQAKLKRVVSNASRVETGRFVLIFGNLAQVPTVCALRDGGETFDDACLWVDHDQTRMRRAATSEP